MDNSINSEMLLSQLRVMADQAQAANVSVGPAGGQANVPSAVADIEAGANGGSDSSGGFAAVMQSAMHAVNNRQLQASETARQFEFGDQQVSLAQVMIEMQKARISFEALTQVRNKFITAYQEVMSMPL